MADKAISELVAAPSVTPDSLFVLQQDGAAKKLTAQVLENWLVSFADGHGGIQSYELLKTEGLVKTYRFTLTDQTPIDIDVVDGRGIASVKPTSTNGLVVTYTMTYNDGTTSAFTVTNGAKGDKGDRADIWVKYASQKPTASSHSFGDIPDSWIGIATGHNMAAAPTDWQAYTWYQWKGEQGDTGEPATLVSAEIRYQVGDSGTVIPSGSWSESIPSVTPGKYLWTRQVLQFNTGNAITSYSVSRFGIDGSGAVSTVAGVAPDENGNVPLDAASVKALALAGGTMEGPINMNGQKLSGLTEPTDDSDAVNKGYVDSMSYPIGSIYLSVKETSPASIFGGSWEQLKSRFLLGAGDEYAVNSTGGSELTSLYEKNLPALQIAYQSQHDSGSGSATVIDGSVLKTGVKSGGWTAVNTGGNKEPHNNMPPYLAVYMWKRVA